VLLVGGVVLVAHACGGSGRDRGEEALLAGSQRRGEVADVGCHGILTPVRERSGRRGEGGRGASGLDGLGVDGGEELPVAAVEEAREADRAGEERTGGSLKALISVSDRPLTRWNEYDHQAP
jgi:hypothetical protein